jgi:hypothetical protein
MGCQRANIFNWSRCCDTCDHCGDWTGQGIIARTNGSQQAYMAGRNQGNQGRAAMASRVVPGTYREMTRVQPAAAEVVEEESVEEEQVQLVEAPRPKRVRSNKARPRVVRAEHDD